MANASRSLRFSKTEIKRAVDAARSAGIDPASVEIGPDGTLRISDARALAKPVDEFTAWESRL